MSINNRFLTFDLMRALGIIIILLHHLPEYTFNYYNLNFLRIPLDLSPLNELNRYLGLGLFIFLSGYLLNLKKPRFNTLESAKTFLQKRFMRIFPLYYLALLFFFYIHDFWNPLHIGIYLLGFQGIINAAIPSPLPTLWFIGLLVAYYSFFVLLMAKKWTKTQQIILALSSGIGIFIINQFFPVADFRLILYIWVFLLGIYSAEYNIFQTKVWLKFGGLTVPLFISTLLILFYIESQESIIIEHLPGYLLINCLMVTFIVSLYYCAERFCQKFLLPPWVLSISYSSYCVYLFHRPLLWFMDSGLHKLLGENHDPLISSFLLTVGIAIIFIVAHFLQSIYDRYGLPYLSGKK